MLPTVAATLTGINSSTLSRAADDGKLQGLTVRGDDVPMPRQTQALPRSRYSYEAVVLEIERMLARMGHGSHSRAAELLGWTTSQFAKRMAGTGLTGERFRLEHLGALADWAQAPMGWPFVSWEQAEAAEQAWKQRR